MLEILRKRRSVRQFTGRAVKQSALDCLVEAALRAPTSRGRNPWRFIFVTDPALIARLSLAKEHGSAFLRNAPLAVVIAADTETSDVWIEDCSIAAIILQLTAEQLGLGSCWAQIRLRPHDSDRSAEDYVRSLLDLPEHHAVECIVGIGEAAETHSGHPADSLESSKVEFRR
ncbi:MAG: nitroreductase family protein [Desulfuromonadales bacterium]|nr:nitroreductase family protein [Desulfuromonadales bacterium]